MKKILLGIALSVVVLQACKKDNDDEEVVVVPIEDQNAYDDAAAIKFMDSNYFNDKGVITAFDDTVTTDDNYPKLSSYPHETLSSGVIYIIRTGAGIQPDPGKTIGTTDVISLMQVTKTYVATKTDDKIAYAGEATFVNNVTISGVPSTDPAYYYVKQSVLDAYNKTNNTSVGRNFYEIEGLQEGLKYFKSFDNLNTETNYNMQGVIIVPSRAAYARDNTIYGTAYANRSFVFNFQLYNTRARLDNEK